MSFRGLSRFRAVTPRADRAAGCQGRPASGRRAAGARTQCHAHTPQAVSAHRADSAIPKRQEARGEENDRIRERVPREKEYREHGAAELQS